jgi:RNA polymerase sigma-70 factor (sigma-E family)
VEFESFAREHTPRLLRFAAVLTNDNGVAEDVVQDVLIKAQRHWPKISSTANPQAYLRRMVVNELTSWRRKWARYVPSSDDRLDRPIADGTSRLDDRAALMAELAKLPPRQRAAIVLRYLEDRSDPEIAAVLGCSAVSVRGYIHRALKVLRVEMAAAPVAHPAGFGKDV